MRIIKWHQKSICATCTVHLINFFCQLSLIQGLHPWSLYSPFQTTNVVFVIKVLTKTCVTHFSKLMKYYKILTLHILLYCIYVVVCISLCLQNQTKPSCFALFYQAAAIVFIFLAVATSCQWNTVNVPDGAPCIADRSFISDSETTARVIGRILFYSKLKYCEIFVWIERIRERSAYV